MAGKAAKATTGQPQIVPPRTVVEASVGAPKPSAIGDQAGPPNASATTGAGVSLETKPAEAVTKPAEAGTKPAEAVPTPLTPRAWSDSILTEISPGNAEDYAKALKASVSARLHAQLSRAPAIGGVGLKGRLHEQKPLDVAKAERNASLKSYKEAWRTENCKVSLDASGLYEAAGNAFWIDPSVAPEWDGQDVPGSKISWSQIAAGRSAWSEEKLKRSAATSNMQHYVVHGAVPTAIPSSGVGNSAIGESFQDLPCFGGRAVLLGWYSVMDDALRASNDALILKLYEAFISMPIRMRVAPTFQQIIKDAISYSEDVYAAQGATTDSSLDFITKASHLVNARKDANNAQFVQEFKDLGLLFHGKPIGDQGVRAFKIVEAYAASGAVQDAFKALEQVTKKLNEQTLIQRLCETCNRYHGKASPAAFGACCRVLGTLRVAMKHKDIRKDSHLTEDFLTGKGLKKAAFVQMVFKK